MEMLLMGACLSIFGLAVACLAFGAATNGADERESVAPAASKAATKAAAVPARFFVEQPEYAAAARNGVPIEALLLQIENHVRLEQAAAESFVECPTSSLLHSRTASPFVN